jgi:hypothetical protein
MADAALNPKINDFTSRARQLAPQIIEVLETLDSLSVEWFSNGYNSNGGNEIEQENLIGENAALTVADLQDLIFTYDTLRSTMDGGHRSNMQIARP